MVSDKVFTTDGSQKIYTSDFPIISEDHIRVFLGSTVVSRDDYDLINNAAVFITAPPAGETLTLQVGTTPADILTSPTDAGIVAANMSDVQTVAGNMTDINTIEDNISDVNTVATNISNVNTVSGINADVTTVASNDTNVTTVADNIGSVNTVATNINEVITVANDLNEAISEVETVADDLNEAISEIEVVSDNITDVQAVGSNITDVNTVATDIANVNTVATNIADVNTVAGIDTDVTTVSGINTDVTTVSGISANVSTVSGISTDVTTVATNNANVTTVANNDTNVTTVAGIDSDVTTVAGISGNVTTVATNDANVTTVATDIANVNTTATDINNVNTVATNISDVNVTATNIQAVIDAYGNANAAAASEAAAAISEAAAAASYDDFDDRYLGDKTTDPSVDNDGNPLLTGALYFNSSDNTMRVYDGSVWIAAYASLSGALIATNNLNDLTDLAQARTNLEVPHIQGDVFTGDVEAPTFIGDFDGAITDLCKNVTAGTLLKGTPVYQSGTAGNAMEVQAADASNAATMPAVGVVGEDIGAGLEGRIILFGKIRGVDTSAFSEGDTIYVGVGGGFTNVAPTGEGNLIQNLGRVIKVHATNGGGMVMGAGRSNATPNLNQGNIFLGDANNQSTTVALSSVANLYVHPTTSGNKHLPSGGSADQILGWSADGTGQWVDNPPAVVTSATAPSNPYLGMYWLDSSTTPHRLNVYNKMHDGTNDWTWVYINRMPSAAGVTASTNPQLTPSGSANVSFSGASDPDVGHAWDGVGLTWEVINISNAWITTSQSSISNTMNPTFTFQGSSSINTSGTFTYDIRVTDAQGHQNVKTGFSGSFINQVNLTLGAYDTGWGWYYDSGTITITAGYISVPSGMPLTQYCYTNLYGDDYIDWIRVGGVTVHNGNWSGSRTACHTGTWNIPSGNQAVQVGLARGYENNDRMYVSSWSFQFN